MLNLKNSKSDLLSADPNKIVFLSPSSNLGGAERVLLDLVKNFPLRKNSYSLEVVCIENGPLVNEIQKLEFPIHIRDIPESLRNIGDSPARSIGFFAKISGLARAFLDLFPVLFSWKRWLHTHKPALIHSNGFKTHILVALSAPRCCNILWHLHDFIGDRGLVRKILPVLWRPGIQAIAISKSVADDFIKHVPDCPVHIWTNVIDLDKFHPFRVDPRWLDHYSGNPAPPNTLRIGLVGTYARWKGQDVFLKAVRDLPAEIRCQARFYVVGGPIYKTIGSQWNESELSLIIQEYGLESRVFLVPFQNEMREVYNSLDVVVHASTRKEPFGLVIAEAMACGRPVVASMAGGAQEIGKTEEHLLGHSPGNHRELAKAIQRLIESKEYQLRLGETGRKHISNNFSAELIKGRWEQMLHGIGIGC